jgi:excisionase family DNA binding protein
MADQHGPYLTPPEIAKRLRVTPDQVLGWIRRGELKAINVSNAYRPRNRVSPEAFEALLRMREVLLPPPRQRRWRGPPPGGPLDPALGQELMKKGKAVFQNGKYYRVWDGITLYF